MNGTQCMHSECKSDILCQTTVRSVCVCVWGRGEAGVEGVILRW